MKALAPSTLILGLAEAEVYVRFRVINCLAVRSGLVFFEDDAAALGLRNPVRTFMQTCRSEV